MQKRRVLVPPQSGHSIRCYAPCPDAQPLDGVETIPPGGVTLAAFAVFHKLLDDHFPPAIRDLLSHTRHEDVSLQPIYDSIVDSYVSQRILLIGDAGTMTRPHTASGATKALEDALALETLAASAVDLPDLLQSYDTQRCEHAKKLSHIGRRIGQMQVVGTPNWGGMSPKDFEDLHTAILFGDKLYLYGEDA